jgi:hypothetical protein
MIFTKKLPNGDLKLTHLPIGLTPLMYEFMGIVAYTDVSGSGHDVVTRLICSGLPFGIITTVYVKNKHLKVAENNFFQSHNKLFHFESCTLKVVTGSGQSSHAGALQVRDPTR